CDVRELWTAVDRIEQLPTTVVALFLGLPRVRSTAELTDPGLQQLPRYCPKLEDLHVHIAAPDDPRRLDDQLSQLPELSGSNYHSLWLSQVTEDHHVTWAINTAKQLLPRSGGYRWLVFPRCGRTCEQLKTMVAAMGAAGITVRHRVIISSPAAHTALEQQELQAAVRIAFPSCSQGLTWCQGDDELIKATNDQW
ncbi:unnamed protein product, partial [Meganyctiphanes norvegica]